MYICIDVYLYMCICIFSVSMYMRRYVYTHMQWYVHMHMYMYMCVTLYMSICAVGYAGPCCAYACLAGLLCHWHAESIASCWRKHAHLRALRPPLLTRRIRTTARNWEPRWWFRPDGALTKTSLSTAISKGSSIRSISGRHWERGLVCAWTKGWSEKKSQALLLGPVDWTIWDRMEKHGNQRPQEKGSLQCSEENLVDWYSSAWDCRWICGEQADLVIWACEVDSEDSGEVQKRAQAGSHITLVDRQADGRERKSIWWASDDDSDVCGIDRFWLQHGWSRRSSWTQLPNAVAKGSSWLHEWNVFSMEGFLWVRSTKAYRNQRHQQRIEALLWNADGHFHPKYQRRQRQIIWWGEATKIKWAWEGGAPRCTEAWRCCAWRAWVDSDFRERLREEWAHGMDPRQENATWLEG